MNRQEILDTYSVDEHGIIWSSGKFEGEMIYVPYLWTTEIEDMEVLSWPDGVTTYLVEINAEDRAMFPELTEADVVAHMQESDQGFVSCETLSQTAADKLRAQCEEECEAASEDEGEEE